jgi:hypothetical protein
MLISRLQQLNIYDRLIRKLTANESADVVSKWAVDVHVEGPPGAWSYWWWRHHVQALQRHVKASKYRILMREARRRLVRPEPPDPAEVLEETKELALSMEVRDSLPPMMGTVYGHVEATLQNLHAEHILKTAFFIQVDRLELIRTFEKKTGFPMSSGDKAVQVLKEIGDSIHKVEVGRELLRGKDGNMPYAPTFAGELQGERSQVAREMAQFDEVDRHLIGEMTARVVNMIEEGSGGRFKVGGLGADTAGKATEGIGAVADAPINDVIESA